ncbi:MAG: DUF308 domain-containing protein [Pseudomonadota bacterium]
MLIIERPPLGYSVFGSITAIVLGIIMLVYPGGVMTLMNAAFWILQLILSVFILSYTISSALQYFKLKAKTTGVLYLLIGVLATVLVWLFNVEVIIMVIGLFFILSGISDIIAGFHFMVGRYFLAFLGVINIVVGIILIRQPLALAWLLAWYVLFWGVSRLFLALEMRRKGQS